MKTEQKLLDDKRTNVNTHSFIQQVSRHTRITASAKLVLIYLLEKYQTTREDGRQWDFSNASIQHGTGLKQRNVYNITNALLKAKVLKHYGEIKRKTRPTVLYLFELEALKAYLKDNETMSPDAKKDIAKSATTTLTNNNNVEINIEDQPKHGDIAKDIATSAIRYCNQCLPQEDKTQEDVQKKEKDTSTNTGLKPTNEQLKTLNELLDNGFYEKSAYPSIVPCGVGLVNNSSGSVSVGSSSIRRGSVWNDSSINKTVAGSAGSSGKFQVPFGIDDKVKAHDRKKERHEQEMIESIFIETMLTWSKKHIPQGIIDKRIAAFKVKADSIKTAVDCIKAMNEIETTINQ